MPTPLADLTAATIRVKRLERELDQARHDRQQAARHAINNGINITEVARTARVARQTAWEWTKK